jgi:polyisoprenoid-binding protein YceI
MKKPLTALALAAVLATPAFAASDSYTLDPNHTFPVFEVSHMGFSTQRGRFNKTSGQVTLDLAAKTGSVALTIDTKSLDMGFATWNTHMSDEGFFNVEKYPTMTFKSDKLVFDGDKVVAAEGQFTLLGVIRPLTVTVSGFHCGANPMNKKPLCAGDVTATFKRSDFGMTKFLPAVGDDIKISVPVEAYKN